MNTDQPFTSHHDEIVFENRNKEYGAYIIRRAYHSNLSKGTFTSFLFVACLFGMAYAAMMLKPVIHEVMPAKPPIDLGKIFKVIPEYKEPPPAAKPLVQHSNAFPTKVVTHDVEPPKAEPETITTSTGPVGDGPIVDNNEPVGIAPNVPVEPVAIESQTLDIAEVMPQYEGGLKALYKFLRKTLRYPSVSQRIGEEGTVYVKFVIDATGAVTAVEVSRGVSAALDKEASRVISLMPHWKPGKQHGSPVNVRMSLPIKFAINQE